LKKYFIARVFFHLFVFCKDATQNIRFGAVHWNIFNELKMKTWQRRLEAAKQKHRPKHKDWSRDLFASLRRQEFNELAAITTPTSSIERIDSMNISINEFLKNFEIPYKPCIIDGIPESHGWDAVHEWTFRKLRKRFGNRYFKCGEDDDGYKVKAKLKYFFEYMKHNKDDSPLYIFDGSFDCDTDSKSLLRDYCVPKFFPDDLFQLVGEKKRPPYRWVLVGPARSGSEVHIDPLGTSAWNTVLKGRKRWVS
jgi:histone arginine demethylase JMJD6